METRGILTPTLTPFDDNGEVDFDAYERLLDKLIAEGIHVIIPCGTTGEFQLLSTEERKEIMKFVAEKVNGHATLFAGTNAPATRDVINLSLYAKDLGYEGLMLAAPYYSLPTTGELITHFKTIAAKVGLPIMLYNFPARTGVDLGEAFLDGMRDTKQVFGIKESSGSMERMHEILVNFSDRYQLVCGADDQALEYFVWGVKGWVAGASNMLPKQHLELYETVVEKRDIEGGVAIMRKLLPIFMLMEQGGKYLQYCKYGCELGGYPVGSVRAPYQGLESADRQKFTELYELATS
jgi:4-hydroxy-tetrahydrodipicolinate synthase